LNSAANKNAEYKNREAALPIEDKVTTARALVVKVKQVNNNVGSTIDDKKMAEDHAHDPSSKVPKGSDDSSVKSKKDQNDPTTAPSAEMMESTFEHVARVQREKKATKADDAEVPEYLWEQHLVNDANHLEYFDTTQWTDTQKKALPTLMRGLRKIALKWWKRHVTLSFGKWLNNQCAATKKPTSAVLMEWQEGRYVWAWKGKQSYLSWHLWRERAFVRNLKEGS
jgi:hypothetical protein